MPAFKILYLRSEGVVLHKALFSTRVVGDDEEEWPSLKEALRELGRHGWRVQMHLTSAGDGSSGSLVDELGFILVNDEKTEREDVERQTQKVTAELASLESASGQPPSQVAPGLDLVRESAAEFRRGDQVRDATKRLAAMTERLRRLESD